MTNLDPIGKHGEQALLFDLDGTLVDSVYQHVLAWREALEDTGIQLSVWRIHRRIGMSGGLFLNALLRETGHKVSRDEAKELLTYLSRVGVPWAIATSGRIETAGPVLALLDL